jgi:tetratricopeptide (TPR) repeat protein
LGVVAGAVALLALVVGLAGATYGLIRATRAEAQARQEAATAEQVSEFLVGLFEVSDPNQARGNEITAREILDQGAERISRELEDQPLVRARLMTTIADVYGLLGMNDKGRPLADEALGIRRAELGDLDPEVADGLVSLAHLTFAGDPDAARSLYEQAIDTYEKTVGPDDIRIAEALAMSAFTLALTGRGAEALPLMERVLAIDERALSRETPGEEATLAMVGETAFTLEGLGPLLEREIEIRERLLGAQHPTLARCLAAMGVVHQMQGDYREARRVMERALEITETAKGPDSPDLFFGFFFLGQLYLETGDHVRARALAERCLALSEKVYGPAAGSTGHCLFGLGVALSESGEFEEAEPILERALDIYESAGGLMGRNVGGVLFCLARVRSETGKLDEARETAERAVSNLEGSAGQELALARALFVLGEIELARGEVSGAESRMLRALELDKAVLGENHPDYVYNRACYHALFGRRDEAIRELRRAVDLGFNRYVGISRDPDMDSLRGDPEFETILAEIKQRAETGRAE